MGDSGLKLTEDDIQLEKITVNPSNHPTNIYRLEIGINQIWDGYQAEQLKQQILDDYEKARKWDEYHKQMGKDVLKLCDEELDDWKQNQKLRELIEKDLKECDWSDNEKWNFHLNRLQTILEETKQS